MKKKQFIKDPIYGYIFLNNIDAKLIDTPYFQRLRRIKQLSGSEYVYPGANHTRFEHSLGVSFLAEKMASSLRHDEDSEIISEDIALIRTAALLHDIGHGPFSHTFEALLSRINKHHEDLSRWLVVETEIKDILSDYNVSPSKVCGLIHGNNTVKNKNYLNQIISSACDVDKMDFIVRDSYHTGAEYGRVDVMRIIYTMGILKGNLAVNYSALSAFEAFLIARVESFRTIYFHKVSRASQLLIIRAMELAEEELGLLQFTTPEEYLELDDYTVWSKLMACKSSQPLMKALARRELIKVAFEREFTTRDEFLQSTISKRKYREQLQQEIAGEAGIAPEAVFIDIPTLPSVPYSHSVDLPTYQIPMFVREGPKQKKRPIDLQKVSKIFEALMGMMYIFRVYTFTKEREKVKRAAEKVFSEKTLATKLSF